MSLLVLILVCAFILVLLWIVNSAWFRAGPQAKRIVTIVLWALLVLILVVWVLRFTGVWSAIAGVGG